jgi:hypothetical protein
LLRALVYTGDFLWLGRRYTGSHAPLVSMEAFQAVQVRLGGKPALIRSLSGELTSQDIRRDDLAVQVGSRAATLKTQGRRHLGRATVFDRRERECLRRGPTQRRWSLRRDLAHEVCVGGATLRPLPPVPSRAVTS